MTTQLLNDVARNGQTQTLTADGAIAGRVHAVEAVKEMLQIFWRYADAVITDGERHHLAIRIEGHSNASAILNGLDCVGEQIAENLRIQPFIRL